MPPPDRAQDPLTHALMFGAGVRFTLAARAARRFTWPRRAREEFGRVARSAVTRISDRPSGEGRSGKSKQNANARPARQEGPILPGRFSILICAELDNSEFAPAWLAVGEALRPDGPTCTSLLAGCQPGVCPGRRQANRGVKPLLQFSGIPRSKLWGFLFVHVWRVFGGKTRLVAVRIIHDQFRNDSRPVRLNS